MKLKICLIAVLMATLSVFADDAGDKACVAYLLQVVEDPSARGTRAVQIRSTARRITKLCSFAEPELREYALGWAAMLNASAGLMENGNMFHTTQYVNSAIDHFEACTRYQGALAGDADFRMRIMVTLKQNMARGAK